jgi:hypothetical protein
VIRKVHYGIQAVGGTTPNQNDNLLITKNFIGDTTLAVNYIGRYGMLLSEATGATISENLVRNVEASEIGIVSSNNVTGIGLSTGFINSTVTRNTITGIRYTGTSGYGGKGIDVSTGNTASNLTISNNMVSNIRGDGWNALNGDAIVGIRVTGTTGGVNLYFNSVNLGSGSFAGNSSGTQSAALYIHSTVVTAGSIDIRNNILRTNLINSTAGTAKTWAINYTGTNNNVFANIDYNDYVTDGATQGVMGLFNATDQANLAAIQGSFGGNTNSQNIVPVFTASFDLHLPPASNATLFDLGTPIAGTTVDLDNDARPATAPDMGADEFSPITLNLKAFIEGYMDMGAMRPVLMNSGIGMSSTLADNITVELHDATSPYALRYSFTGVLETDGDLACTFASGARGNTYYIVLKHRNALETWSKSAGESFPNVTNSYDFSTAASQAFGSNMVQVGALWCLYSGDFEDGSPDGYVDNFDYNIWEADYNNLESGYRPADLDGNGTIDNFDYNIWEANYNGLVERQLPPP